MAASFGPLLVNHLGAKSLDLRTYLMDYVPTAFGAVAPPPPQIRSELLRLVARHIGEIRDDDAVRNTLRALPMVPCEDAQFRASRHLYLRSDELVLVLGDAPSGYVEQGWAARPGVVDVLRWLGAAGTPRAEDVLARADEVTALGGTEGRAAAGGCSKFWPVCGWMVRRSGPRDRDRPRRCPAPLHATFTGRPLPKAPSRGYKPSGNEVYLAGFVLLAAFGSPA